jgi:hypothetical protein
MPEFGLGEVMKKSPAPLQRLARLLARTAVILTLVLVALWALFYVSFHVVLQAAHASLASHPNPAADYAAAIARFQQIQQTEGPELNPVARSILLTRGQRTERAVVFFHTGTRTARNSSANSARSFTDWATTC